MSQCIAIETTQDGYYSQGAHGYRQCPDDAEPNAALCWCHRHAAANPSRSTPLQMVSHPGDTP